MQSLAKHGCVQRHEVRQLSKIWIRWNSALWHEGNLWTWSQIWPLIYKTSSLNHCTLSSRIKCEKMKHDIVWLMILTLYIGIFYTWLKPKDFFNNYLLSGMCLGLSIVYLTHTKNIQRTAKNSCKIIKNRNLITKTVNYLPEL